MSGDWDAFHRRWARLAAPLRPTGDVVDAIEAVLSERDACRRAQDRVLLLGVTPELARVAPNLLAIDWSASMIARVWPGDAPTRHAIRADWRHLPLGPSTCTGVIGDGSINCLRYAADYRALLGGVATAMRSGGVLAMRVYVRPDRGESISEVAAAAQCGASFHAIKWRIAMALAAASGAPNVEVARVHAAFERVFPDRRALAAKTGWTDETIAEIDAYSDADLVYSFPTAAELIATLPRAFEDVRLIGSGRYPLAERCPIFVARRT